MKVLIVDPDKVGLDLAMQAKAAGHTAWLWLSKERGAVRSRVGDGLVDRVEGDWVPLARKADLIILTDCSKYRAELRPLFKEGRPIFGANDESAALELDREVGQQVLEKHGIDTLPYETFSTYDKAIAYVKKTQKPYVVKPWGGTSDKALTYVADSPDDLIFTLEHFRKKGYKGEFMLQEKCDGIEMAASGWFGPGGWSEPIEECWEEKKFLAGGLGCNTGEQGTTVRYTKKSKLFDKVLKPLDGWLAEHDYVGDIDVNCIIDAAGKPWPLEFTCRLGWPDWNIRSRLHEGDPVEWMLDLIEGKDTLKVRYETAVGVVLTHCDFPYDHQPYEDSCGFPIYGLRERDLPSVALQAVCAGKEFKQATDYCTAGDYVMVVDGVGASVSAARRAAYRIAWGVKWPSNRGFRIDIGERLKKQLPKLQEQGYAMGLEY